MNWQNAAFVRSYASAEGLPDDGLPQVVFAGRSNVGKSSVLCALALNKNLVRVSGTPGKTALINFFCVDKQLYLVDLPGYGYAKVSQAERLRWARMMESYFARPERITKGVLILDARHEPTELDGMMAGWFRNAGVPFIAVANKIDKLKPSQREAALALIRETLSLSAEQPLIAHSAQTREGREALMAEIEKF